MSGMQNGTSARNHNQAGGRLSEIWADITNAQRRFAAVNRPWVTGRGRTGRSR